MATEVGPLALKLRQAKLEVEKLKAQIETIRLRNAAKDEAASMNLQVQAQQLAVESLKAQNEAQRLEQANTFFGRWGQFLNTGLIAGVLALIGAYATNSINEEIAKTRLTSEEKRHWLDLYFDQVANTDLHDRKALLSLSIILTSVPDNSLTRTFHRSFGERVWAIVHDKGTGGNAVSYRDIASNYSSDFMEKVYPPAKYRVYLHHPPACTDKAEAVKRYLQRIGFSSVILDEEEGPNNSDVRFYSTQQEEELEGLIAGLTDEFKATWKEKNIASIFSLGSNDTLEVWIGKRDCNDPDTSANDTS